MTQKRVTLKTAAQAYDVSYQKLWEAVRADQLPAMQHGTRWYVRPEDVAVWFDETSTPNGAELARRSA